MGKFIPLTSDVLSKYEQISPDYQTAEHRLNALYRYKKNSESNYESIDEQLHDEAQIICVGDMLCEEKLYLSHHSKTNNKSEFYFDDIFQFVRPELKKADLVIGNLETTICESAPYTGEQYKINGKYHCNAPVAFLDAIQKAGFDFLMLANNHNCDCGVNGALETLHHIDAKNIMRTGLFSLDDKKRYTLVKVKNITLGLLSYSTWYNRNETNFTDLGREQILNEYRAERIKRDIIEAKKDGAEFILVYMHWGIDAEYKSIQSETMKRMAQEVADSGADYIIGSHTHSIQPYSVLTSNDGRKVPCVYSLGNFVTSELNKISRENLIWKINLCKKDGIVLITKEDYIPCYIPDYAYHCAFPVIPRSMDLDNSDFINKSKEVFHRIDTVVRHFEQNFNKETFLTKSNICKILGLSEPAYDESYTTLEYAIDAQPGCVALIWNCAFDPYIPTTKERQIELADIAIKRGAKLLISSFQIGTYPCLVVDGYPFDSFSKIIAAIRNQWTPKTIGITGSIGKTSTTGMVNAVLGYKYKTFGNVNNANSARFSAKLIQQLSSDVEVYIQETMETPPYGLAGMISKMVQPEAAIVTRVGTSHMKALGSQERIAESCMSIQEGMPEDGLLILNGDDPYQCNAKLKRKAVYYGIENENASYRAINIHSEEDYMLFDIVHDGIVTPARLNCFGQHNILNALAAFAAGKWAGMTDDEIVAGLNSFRTKGIRQNLVKYGGYRLFLDCYNAASESMESAFHALASMKVTSGGKRIAVLADIKETGEKDEEIHRKVGQLVLKSPIDLLICYGESSKFIAEVVEAANKIPVYHTINDNELELLLRKHITTSDVTLFKGSRGMALERFVDRVFGTWFYESDEDAIAHSKTVADENFRYRVYLDHAKVIEKVSDAKKLTIPNTIHDIPVTGIEQSVFNKSKSFTYEVELPNSLENIRYCAFYKVNRLEKVTIPSSVKIIDTSAFSTCANLESVEIEPGCTHIGYRAFGNCPKLKSVTIPASVQQIGSEAFLNCSELTIYGNKGSYAEQYAKRHNIPFKVIGMNPAIDDNKKEITENIRKKKSLFDIFTKKD